MRGGSGHSTRCVFARRVPGLNSSEKHCLLSQSDLHRSGFATQKGPPAPRTSEPSSPPGASPAFGAVACPAHAGLWNPALGPWTLSCKHNLKPWGAGRPPHGSRCPSALTPVFPPGTQRKRPPRPHPPSVLVTRGPRLTTSCFSLLTFVLSESILALGTGRAGSNPGSVACSSSPASSHPGSRGGSSGEWTRPAPTCEPGTRMARFSAPGELCGFAAPRFPQLKVGARVCVTRDKGKPGEAR